MNFLHFSRSPASRGTRLVWVSKNSPQLDNKTFAECPACASRRFLFSIAASFGLWQIFLFCSWPTKSCENQTELFNFDKSSSQKLSEIKFQLVVATFFLFPLTREFRNQELCPRECFEDKIVRLFVKLPCGFANTGRPIFQLPSTLDSDRTVPALRLRWPMLRKSIWRQPEVELFFNRHILLIFF